MKDLGLNIMHYALGLPPHRTGGLTKYVSDLMVEQTKNHTVSLLYPKSSMMFYSGGGITLKKEYKGVRIFVLKDSLPVPLLEGIKKPLDFIEKLDEKHRKKLEAFIMQEKIDVFHIHTLMGLPLSLVEVLKSKGVKIIYSTHDYFGLCPKVNFIKDSGILCQNTQDCYHCNINAPSTIYLRYIRNSEFILQKRLLLAKLKKIKRFVIPTTKRIDSVFVHSSNDSYSLLRDFHIRIFSLIDSFHFNSTITKMVYEKYFMPTKSKVINISHAGLEDNRRPISVRNKCLKIGYIGSSSVYKGFPLLISTLIHLYNNNVRNWEIFLGGDITLHDVPKELQAKTHFIGKYDYNNINTVFSQFDLLIMPSLCFETFGFVAMEAVSYGIPVMLSDTCGVKDIIQPILPEMVIKMGNKTLYSSIHSLLERTDLIPIYNSRILAAKINFSFTHHTNEINELYLETIQGTNN